MESSNRHKCSLSSKSDPIPLSAKLGDTLIQNSTGSGDEAKTWNMDNGSYGMQKPELSNF